MPTNVNSDLLSIVLSEVKAAENFQHPVEPTGNQKSKQNIMTDKTTTPAVHEISAEAKAVSEYAMKHIFIDPATGVASPGEMKFSELLMGKTTEENVELVLGTLNSIAVGLTNAHGIKSAEAIKGNSDLVRTKGSYPGPGRAHLDVSYKHTHQMPTTEGGSRVTHGSTMSSWKNLGGPHGKDFDAVKASLRAQAEENSAK